MSTYNTETVNAQFINQAFLDKIDQGLTKEASVASTAFVRQRLREDGFTRKILPPVAVTAAELDRQLTEEPVIIVEKEPDTTAASLPFLGRSEIQYWTTPRYPVAFQKLASADFRKSKFELATYRTDIRTVLQENSVKDLQAQEDSSFYNGAYTLTGLNGNANRVAPSGGFSKAGLMSGVKKMLSNKLPIGCILMTQSMYADLLTLPSTDIGSPAASDLFRGQGTLDNFFGYKIITTNKSDILLDTQALIFAPPQYLGQMYTLQDATMFLKVEQDIIEFTTYESIGIGIGNVNGVVAVNF
jgi:hypothetical protein